MQPARFFSPPDPPDRARPRGSAAAGGRATNAMYDAGSSRGFTGHPAMRRADEPAGQPSKGGPGGGLGARLRSEAVDVVSVARLVPKA